MSDSTALLDRLVEAHLAGQPVNVPTHLRLEFDHAVAAHGALRKLLAETAAVEDATPPRAPPRLPEQYELERELGRGGMGVVYLARQRALDRRVALKVLRPGERTFGTLIRRFLDEARHLAQLRHPNIVSIHEVGDAEGEPYFTMDYIDGGPLSTELAHGPMTPSRAVTILKQIAAAVQHAHRQGIIHRDLKPGNVLLDQAGQVYVTDFGLARNVTQESGLTQSGELLGTPQYMAPEQARGQSALIGEATDVHALGLLMFEMLTGRAAFSGASPADVLVRLLHEEPPPLRTIDRRIPRDLETICLKALQKSPGARYANVSALLEDLRRYEAGEPLLARRTGTITRFGRWIRRHGKLATIILAAAAVGAALAPRWFDPTAPALIAWADEELKAGRPEIATEVYLRAWSRSDAAKRAQFVPALTRAISEVADAQRAVDAALRIVPEFPDVSFGKYDFLVAQALAMTARADLPGGVFEPQHGPIAPESLARRELAARRLALFLDGAQGTRDERKEAERTLQAIERSLRPFKPVERWTTDPVVRLPEGPADELRQRLSDPAFSPWDRGKAALAWGRRLEVDSKAEAALDQYRIAFELIRPVYPFVSGVVSHNQLLAAGRDPSQMEAPECRLVRDLLDSLRRLDPLRNVAATGGLRLSVDRPDELRGVQISVALRLCDPAVKDPNEGLPRELSTTIPLNLERGSEVRVLPGRYRIAVAGISKMWTPTEGVVPQLIDVVASDWPETVDVGDAMLDLPPLRVRSLTKIEMREPMAGAQVDLTRDALRWDPVPGAAWYDVTLIQYSDQPRPTATHFRAIRVTRPELWPDRLDAREIQDIVLHWRRGYRAGFRVQAFDAAGERLGLTTDERQFLIGTPLPQH